MESLGEESFYDKTLSALIRYRGCIKARQGWISITSLTGKDFPILDRHSGIYSLARATTLFGGVSVLNLMVYFCRIEEILEGWFPAGITIAGTVGFFLVLFLCLVLLMPLLIGILVWRDAERRGLNRVWALAAALIPNFLGLIAYLIVASQQKPKIQCPKCNNSVERDANNCSMCGHKFEPANCPKCNKAVSPEWKLCPECGQQLE